MLRWGDFLWLWLQLTLWIELDWVDGRESGREGAAYAICFSGVCIEDCNEFYLFG